MTGAFCHEAIITACICLTEWRKAESEIILIIPFQKRRLLEASSDVILKIWKCNLTNCQENYTGHMVRAFRYMLTFIHFSKDYTPLFCLARLKKWTYLNVRGVLFLLSRKNLKRSRRVLSMVVISLFFRALER